MLQLVLCLLFATCLLNAVLIWDLIRTYKRQHEMNKRVHRILTTIILTLRSIV